MPNESQKDLVVEAREFLPEVTQERKSAFCKAVTHKVVLSKAEWLIQQLCSEVEQIRPMTDPQTKPELLSDEALAAHKAHLDDDLKKIAEFGVSIESYPWLVRERDLHEYITALREQYESAVTDFAVEINALREQLAEAHKWIDRKNAAIETWQQQAKENATRLAQVVKERDKLRADLELGEEP